MEHDYKDYRLITLHINKNEYHLFVRNADTLLHVLREQAGLMSVKPGCENGDCGSCTILIDGTPVNACHILAVEACEFQITTIEGLDDSILQETFITNNAIQCGYCTSGMIMNSYALLKHHPDADDKMIKEWLDSNICRCTGYQEIKEAVKMAQKGMKNSG